jgi:hypothetical protein
VSRHVSGLLQDLSNNLDTVDRAELPAVLGRLVELEARVRLRLAEVPTAVAPTAARVITGDEMATIAGTSKRDILAKTRGMRFRCDLSRKQPRALEAEFRRWLTDRRRA